MLDPHLAAAVRGEQKQIRWSIALVRIVVTSLADQVRNVVDWDAGDQLAVPGTDFPATTVLELAFFPGETSLTVFSTDRFTIPRTDGSGVVPGYLILTTGTNREIISYTDVTALTFDGITRGLYGTAPQTWFIGTSVHQLEFSHGTSPSFDLEMQRRGWWQRR